ncbi:casparian strip membrane protein 4-like [Populus alba x Populus x berolinensis]|nr:casparian strip membrane protein 4-like [Populus alba x Populus x berolinensis]
MAFDVTSFLSLGQEAKADTKEAQHPRKGWRKGIAIFDLVLELSAIVAGLATTSVTDHAFPFFQFQAQLNDLPTLIFFMVANAIASEPLALLRSRTEPPPCPL